MDIALLAWDENGLAVLQALNTPEGKLHLGGPESPDKLADRHRRYLGYSPPGETECFMVAMGPDLVGSVVYWQGEDDAYEVGWEIAPAWQGRGIGARAVTLMLHRLAPLRRHDYAFAYPTPDNAGSNGICRKLGFELIETRDVEYPRGAWSPHNVWRRDLRTWLSGGAHQQLRRGPDEIPS